MPTFAIALSPPSDIVFNMTRRNIISWLLILTALSLSAEAIAPEDFVNPPEKYRPVPLWFWNNTAVDSDTALSQLQSFTATDGYGGCAILPFGRNFKPEYMSADYLDAYGRIVRYAADHGLKMSLYDEYDSTNLNTEEISMSLRLRDKMSFKTYNPHTGEISDTPVNSDGSLPLNLQPCESLFLVSE